jgi:hypothetical protein
VIDCKQKVPSRVRSGPLIRRRCGGLKVRKFDHASDSPRFSGDSANLVYSPTIGSLDHDRIAIERHVENEDPNSRRNPTDSKAVERNGECQYKRRTVAYLCAFRSEFDAIQEFMTVHWLHRRWEAVQHGP